MEINFYHVYLFTIILVLSSSGESQEDITSTTPSQIITSPVSSFIHSINNSFNTIPSIKTSIMMTKSSSSNTTTVSPISRINDAVSSDQSESDTSFEESTTSFTPTILLPNQKTNTEETKEISSSSSQNPINSIMTTTLLIIKNAESFTIPKQVSSLPITNSGFDSTTTNLNSISQINNEISSDSSDQSEFVTSFQESTIPITPAIKSQTVILSHNSSMPTTSLSDEEDITAETIKLPSSSSHNPIISLTTTPLSSTKATQSFTIGKQVPTHPITNSDIDSTTTNSNTLFIPKGALGKFFVSICDSSCLKQPNVIKRRCFNKVNQIYLIYEKCKATSTQTSDCVYCSMKAANEQKISNNRNKYNLQLNCVRNRMTKEEHSCADSRVKSIRDKIRMDHGFKG